MANTNKERVLDFIWNKRPKRVTNTQVRQGTGVEPHQQVYQITREFREKQLVKATRRGRTWVFWMEESAQRPQIPTKSTPRKARLKDSDKKGQSLTPYEFESLARSVMSKHFGVALESGEIPGVPKEFDIVSRDLTIVGDAKYYTLVRGKRLPPAKFSVIAEHVWLLENTHAEHRFLVFGNQRAVPEVWLEKYGNLIAGIDFYFLTDDGNLELLTK